MFVCAAVSGSIYCARVGSIFCGQQHDWGAQCGRQEQQQPRLWVADGRRWTAGLLLSCIAVAQRVERRAPVFLLLCALHFGCVQGCV